MEEKKINTKESSRPLWIGDNTVKIKNPITRLHNEIMNYCKYISLSEEEIQLRKRSIEIIETYVKDLWPQCKLIPFGSYVAGLSLYNSDIDVTIITNDICDCGSYIITLANHLKSKNAFTYLEKVFYAKVPILKLTLKETGISMDVSLNIKEVKIRISIVQELLVKYPPLKWLVLLVKSMLREKHYNDTCEGGIGSYLLIIIVTAYLQYEKKSDPKVFSKKTLGHLLTGFLEFYGQKFNYKTKGIDVRGDGCLFTKFCKSNSLTVKNPRDPEDDLGQSVTLIEYILGYFRFISCRIFAHKLQLASIPLLKRS